MRSVMENSSPMVRRLIQVRGQVQGVGFRPFVYRLAHRHHLAGFIRNDASGVTIEVQGSLQEVDLFQRALREERPQLAVVEDVAASALNCCGETGAFHIEPSREAGDQKARVTVDTALCPACLREMLDEENHRAGYGLINCTDCGPRYSIVRRVPYDRPNTTMAEFEMCPRCRGEYVDPLDRRFHAQPIACHDCGPQIQLLTADGKGKYEKQNAIDQAVALLCGGRIVAIKGLGGFHLACRAADEEAVGRLRKLKHRDAKPFALMCANLKQARQLVNLSDRAAEAMTSPACPIVLAGRREGGLEVSPQVAPGNHRLGVLLPYTPMHHLLFARGGEALGPLVMTSGNVSDEPLVIDNDEAAGRLGGLCDAFLWHDRGIHRCVDDSVLIDMGSQEPLPVRRARGYVPSVVKLPVEAAAPGLCLGGELKNTVAVVRQSDAILSHHLGNLTHPLAFEYFKRAVDDLCDLFDVRPQWVACDLHPQYLSSVYAREISHKVHAPLLSIQHHHAHAAAVMAEHGRTEPVLAVVCDGVGYGPDKTLWGGELLLAGLTDFRRLAHLRPLRLPGGDAAAKDTRRCALALLHQALGENFAEHPAARRLAPDDQERTVLSQMIRGNVNCIASSAAGRVFDGAAALLGLCQHNQFEAQAAMRLESAADGVSIDSSARLFEIEDGTPMQIDLSGLIRHLLEEGRGVPESAALFHEQLAAAWEAVLAVQMQRTGISCVALSGGVFCNQRLSESLTRRLERRGMQVLRHRVAPPNDGGLSLGQAVIAAARSRSA